MRTARMVRMPHAGDIFMQIFKGVLIGMRLRPGRLQRRPTLVCFEERLIEAVTWARRQTLVRRIYPTGPTHNEKLTSLYTMT